LLSSVQLSFPSASLFQQTRKYGKKTEGRVAEAAADAATICSHRLIPAPPLSLCPSQRAQREIMKMTASIFAAA